MKYFLWKDHHARLYVLTIAAFVIEALLARWNYIREMREQHWSLPAHHSTAQLHMISSDGIWGILLVQLIININLGM